MRIALLTEIPAPYRVPLFNALAAEEGVVLRVLFLAERDPRRPFYRVHADEHRFDAVMLPGRQLMRGGRWVLLSRGTVRELQRFRPDVVIVGGWNQPAHIAALVWGRARRIPVVSWVESTARDARSGAWYLEWPKRTLIGAFTGFLVPGRASAEYLESFGVAPDRVAVAPNAVDPRIFGGAAVDRPARERPSFLYVGRLDPEKGLDVLLEAMRGLDAELVIVGSGRLEDELRAAAPANVRFAGQVDRDAVVPFYAAADAFVLPSRSEQWGMVLNEAALAGLPLVATDAGGAAYELIEDGVNGFRVPAGDAAALRAALERLAVDADFRARAGRHSLQLGMRLTPQAWASAVTNLARTLVD